MDLARRRVGRTGLTVAALGLGGAPLSGFRISVSERQGVDIVRRRSELQRRPRFHTAKTFS
jgi:aryl-alcohol dehydrogenase-like predicted oxidoreductase